ncbi:uroporphyrin-III C-methyltransferase [Rhizophlyctis rosea]|nr:uroporphyrin-III C-methyltransferase [Rhizophlyctis rosea]
MGASDCTNTNTLTKSPPTLLTTLLTLLPFHLAHYARILLSYLPQPHRPTGTITLVGAGPGHINNLTLLAYTHIRNADLIISDRLIHPTILAIARGKILQLPRHERKASDDAQDDADRWMVEGYRAGLRVVRLKGGNGFVFGRGGEEVLFLRSQGIKDITIVPGMTSCVAAGESALIPVTHRGVADQFLVMTGRREGGMMPNIPKYEPRRTLVIMMGIGRLGDLVKRCVDEEEFPSWVPVAVVEKGTWEAQRVVRGTLATIERVVKESGIKCHAIIYVGGVVDVLREEMGGVHVDEGVDVGAV